MDLIASGFNPVHPLEVLMKFGAKDVQKSTSISRNTKGLRADGMARLEIATYALMRFGSQCYH